MEIKKYTGGCHCGKVRYEVMTDLQRVLIGNCSHCEKKGPLLDFVDKTAFKLISGEEVLTDYRFNKKAIRHLFCSICGVESYAEGVEFPKAAINVRCLDDIDITTLTLTPYNGKDH